MAKTLMIDSTTVFFYKNHLPLLGTPLRKELMDPTPVHNIGAVDRILLGMCSQPSMRRDEHIVDELTNHLFQHSKLFKI